MPNNDWMRPKDIMPWWVQLLIFLGVLALVGGIIYVIILLSDPANEAYHRQQQAWLDDCTSQNGLVLGRYRASDVCIVDGKIVSVRP